MRQGKVIRLIRFVFYGALIVILANIISKFDWSVFRSIEINYWPVLFASFLALLFRFISAAQWQSILSGGFRRLRTSEKLSLLNAYSISWVSRYFPGGIVTLGSRVYLASRVGFQPFEVTGASLLEVLFQVVALVLITVLFLGDEFNFIQMEPSVIFLSVGIIALSFIFGFSVLIRVILSFLQKFGYSKEFESVLAFSKTKVLFYLAGYFFSNLLVGTAYYLLLFSFYSPLQLSAIGFVIGVISFSGIVSIVSVFAPGGIGVREGILVLLLVQIVPKEIALSLAVISRIWGIVLDFIFFLMVNGIVKAFSRKNINA